MRQARGQELALAPLPPLSWNKKNLWWFFFSVLGAFFSTWEAFLSFLLGHFTPCGGHFICYERGGGAFLVLSLYCNNVCNRGKAHNYIIMIGGGGGVGYGKYRRVSTVINGLIINVKCVGGGGGDGVVK